MDQSSTSRAAVASRQFLARLAKDKSGNTFALIAASIAPLLALIGGGIDMSRSYLSQARLQQACDAGVLAARKQLGSAVVTDGTVPSSAVDAGNRFFKLNYREGAYGSENRTFAMSVEDDYAIRGEANVNVPTTLMAIFGFEDMPIKVTCEAQLNFSDTDVMFVLDTTGSMGGKNPGDSMTRIDALRQTVKDFHAQLEGSKNPGTRIRYGFVPYSVNVNVGGLLEDDWVVDEWTYQSREWEADPDSEYEVRQWINWTYVSGTANDSIVDSYPATAHTWTSTGKPGTGEGSTGSGGGSGTWYSCDRPQPKNTATNSDTVLSTTYEDYAGNPPGSKRTERVRRTTNGTVYWTWLNGTTCKVTKSVRTNYVEDFDRVAYSDEGTWIYKPVTKDVTNWRAETAGCMEERDTYEIYSMDENIDFDRALDLNIDEVPTPGNPSTQWRPMYPDIIWARALKNALAESWMKPDTRYAGDYFKPAKYDALVNCPTPARRMAEMTGGEIASYVDGLTVGGQTYHDIGMIWGGRLLSPTGLFSTDNQAEDGKQLTRHLIFLTDGKTEPLDISYTSYGLEPLDERRWTDRPDPLLDRTIEMRFGIACNEVKKRNITVWVVGFGTTMNTIMKQCAGEGHWFQADDAEELKETFEKIDKSLAELRITE